MRFTPLLVLTTLLSACQQAVALNYIESSSLNTCQDNSSFTASLFNVIYTSNNNTLTFDIVGVSSIQGNVSINVEVTAYGYQVVTDTLNPCEQSELSGMCPMSTGQIDMHSNIVLDDSVSGQIPSIVYNVPDLDANVRVIINSTDNPPVSLACVEASLSNGKTVDQVGVGWSTAVIAGMGLVASAVASGLGHSNTAAHVASNALSLFGYLQGQAIFGFSSVHMPPIVQSWTQNFEWTMGIIEVDFMQTMATWYQRATGGSPSTVLNSLTTTSVEVLKKRSWAERSLDTTIALLERAHAAHQLVRRDTSGTGGDDVTGTYVVRGIDRVAFRAGIESTNFFFTGLCFFIVFVIVTIAGVSLFKGFCEMAVKAGWMKSDKFLDFRNGWLTVLKGIMYRIVLIGYAQMTVLSLWEFTQVDSPAEVVLAIFFFFGMSFTLGWASWKVVSIARRSVTMHKNPAYILYSDPAALNKWGFLYVQFRATAYYYIVPSLVYIILKGMFIGLSQASPRTQSIGLLLIEAGWLISASVVRPWMDKSTNSFNISIAAINFINAVFLLVFTDIFDLPGLVTGVMGVVFFIMNAAFALVLLLLVLIATIYAIVRKNPDTRYQPMQDDRASFIKSQTNLTTELDALGATARGEMKGGYKGGIDLDDDDSWSGESGQRPNESTISMSGASGAPAPARGYPEPPLSPADPSVPLFPSHNAPSAPPTYSDSPRYSDRPMGPTAYNSGAPAFNSGPTAYSSGAPAYNTPGATAYTNNPGAFRVQHNASPWQRGAGYDH